MKHATYAFLMLACTTNVALADEWSFPKTLARQEQTFGESKLVIEIDGTKDSAFPPHTLSIYAGDQLLAKYKNVAFQQVFASNDNKFFVGLSNHGIPGTAFVVFDALGNLLREEKHQFLPRGIHKLQSVVVIQTWYDAANPNVEFDIRNDRLVAVFVNGFDKQRFDLLTPDLGFRKVPADR